jgi:hypothetical protein
MREAHQLIRAAFEQQGLDYPLLVQGEGSRSELLERFRGLGNAVLVGSHSFWEGVDVRGEALSVVVIDRIPFAPPDDPVLAARIEAIQSNGGSGFLDYQLPQAAITLKQGVGRLIRDEPIVESWCSATDCLRADMGGASSLVFHRCKTRDAADALRFRAIGPHGCAAWIAGESGRACQLRRPAREVLFGCALPRASRNSVTYDVDMRRL